MYQLSVLYPGKATAQATYLAESATEVLELLVKLKTEHPECGRIEVLSGARKLFDVDCRGAS